MVGKFWKSCCIHMHMHASRLIVISCMAKESRNLDVGMYVHEINLIECSHKAYIL